MSSPASGFGPSALQLLRDALATETTVNPPAPRPGRRCGEAPTAPGASASVDWRRPVGAPAPIGGDEDAVTGTVVAPRAAAAADDRRRRTSGGPSRGPRSRRRSVTIPLAEMRDEDVRRDMDGGTRREAGLEVGADVVAGERCEGHDLAPVAGDVADEARRYDHPAARRRSAKSPPAARPSAGRYAAVTRAPPMRSGSTGSSADCSTPTSTSSRRRWRARRRRRTVCTAAAAPRSRPRTLSTASAMRIWSGTTSSTRTTVRVSGDSAGPVSSVTSARDRARAGAVGVAPVNASVVADRSNGPVIARGAGVDRVLDDVATADRRCGPELADEPVAVRRGLSAACAGVAACAAVAAWSGVPGSAGGDAAGAEATLRVAGWGRRDRLMPAAPPARRRLLGTPSPGSMRSPPPRTSLPAWRRTAALRTTPPVSLRPSPPAALRPSAPVSRQGRPATPAVTPRGPGSPAPAGLPRRAPASARRASPTPAARQLPAERRRAAP